MTPKEILDIVAKQADNRMDETIGRLMEILRHRHTHQCWRKECGCEYCRFINGEYVNAKLAKHTLKKRINRIDYWTAMDWEMTLMPQLCMDMIEIKSKIKMLREHKKDLKENII